MRNTLPLSGHQSEVEVIWVQVHGDGLPRPHVYALEAEERLQRDAILPSARRGDEAKHDVVGIHVSSVGNVDKELCCGSSLLNSRESHEAMALSLQQRVHLGEGDYVVPREWSVLEGGVAEAEAEWNDWLASVETVG